jgi:hypothetical protein
MTQENAVIGAPSLSCYCEFKNLCPGKWSPGGKKPPDGFGAQRKNPSALKGISRQVFQIIHILMSAGCLFIFFEVRE